MGTTTTGATPQQTSPTRDTQAANLAPQEALARNWWAIALRGAVAILFGLAAFLLPFVTIQSLVLLFAAYMLADGVFSIVAGVRAAARHERWGLLILEGVLNLLAGIVALLLPGLSVLVFVLVLGAWSVVSGIVMAVAAFRLQGTHGRGWMFFAGLLSAIWGVLLYLSPIAGALVLTWWLGGYAMAFGLMLLVVAIRLRRQRGLALPTAAAR